MLGVVGNRRRIEHKLDRMTLFQLVGQSVIASRAHNVTWRCAAYAFRPYPIHHIVRDQSAF